MIRQLSKTVFLGIIAFFLISGCQYQKSPINPIVVSNIETEFNIRMFEQLGANNRLFVLHLSSVKLADCLNGGINYSLTNTADSGYNLTIKKTIDPGNCIEGIGPYQADVYIGRLENGTYNISINLQDVVENPGFLVVDDNQYELQLNSSHGLSVSDVVLHKIPNAFVWGYVAMGNLSDKTAAEEFISTLSSRGYALELKEGDYGHFYVLSSGQLIRLDTQLENPSVVLPIAFGYTGDWTDLTDEVEAFRQSHPNIDVRLFNNKGFVY